MQRRKHVQHLAAETRSRVGAERMTAARQECEHRRDVPTIDTAKGLAVAGRDRCHHELKTRFVPECHSCSQGSASASNTASAAAKPVLVIEVVDRHEIALPSMSVSFQ